EFKQCQIRLAFPADTLYQIFQQGGVQSWAGQAGNGIQEGLIRLQAIMNVMGEFKQCQIRLAFPADTLYQIFQQGGVQSWAGQAG
ncbi:hypothetical protein CTI14_66960, partial [Methylobacterium radiotolerans]